MSYVVHLFILISIYLILAQSLNLITGHAGMISVGHAAFFGIGAYVAALASINLSSGPLVTVAIAFVLASGLSLTLGLASVRMGGDQFVIATYGFQLTVWALMNNCEVITGGPRGIAGVKRPYFLGLSFQSNDTFAIVVFACVTITVAACYLISTAAIGRVLRGIREDEAATQASGKNTVRAKLTIIAVGAGLAAVGGCLYAWYVSFVDPTTFTVNESIFVLSLVLIGGAGSVRGPILGALLLVSLPEVLRFVGMSATPAAHLRQIFYGVGLILVALLRPQGIIGRPGFGR